MIKLKQIKNGIKIIKDQVKLAPEKPGVYRMLDSYDKVLYVGKAKNIKKRIVAYTHFEKLPIRLQRMVSECVKMELIITENENKALLLENDLIKKLNPKYNILLKDDKTFPHIMINHKENYPKITKHRGVKNKDNIYFGPFASVYAVNNTIAILQKAFLLRNCSDNIFKNRTSPCMMHQIKRCSAPCVNKISMSDYQKLVKDAINFLNGKNSNIQTELAQKMQKASDNLDFEKASIYRDRIKALTKIQNTNNIEYAGLNSADLIAVENHNNLYAVQVFFIRNGQNCGHKSYFIKSNNSTKTEALEGFIEKFYQKHIPAKEIIISENIINIEFIINEISENYEFNIKITHPIRGNKLKLIANVKLNAKEALNRQITTLASHKENLSEFAKRFKLNKIPKRIEIYDNSHIQGSYQLGAMVVATPEGFDKKQYRIFNIKSQNIKGDDFAMMKEVLKRRFEKINDENKPDVILIDGGRGQLNSVHEILNSYDLSDIKIIAISKGRDRNAGREQFHIIDQESFSLEYQSQLLFYLQTLRDESHRFAIGSHRKKRGKSMTKSSIDNIDGIGKIKKKMLLNHFGSVSEIENASIEDLINIEGINTKTAEKIYNYFNSKN
jgi:excinuclease ABC subunit C